MPKVVHTGKGKGYLTNMFQDMAKSRNMALMEIFKTTYGESETATKNKNEIPMDVRVIILVCVLRWYEALNQLQRGELYPAIERAMNNTETFCHSPSNYKLLEMYCPDVAQYYVDYCANNDIQTPVIHLPTRKSNMFYSLAIHHALRRGVVDLFVDVDSKKVMNSYFYDVFAGCFMDRDEKDENVTRMRSDIARLFKIWLEDEETKKQKEEVALSCFEIIEKSFKQCKSGEIMDPEKTRVDELYKAEKNFSKNKRAFAEDAVSRMLLLERDGVYKKCRYEEDEEKNEEDEEEEES